VHRVFRVVSVRFFLCSAMNILLSLTAEQSIHLIVGEFYEGSVGLPGRKDVSSLTNCLPPLRGKLFGGKNEVER